jgi:hypothetical protein
LAEEKEKYLGVFLQTNSRAQDATENLLVDKSWGKFAGWKVNLLSPAGRVALIKYVMVSLPVYYMSIVILSTKNINELTTLQRKFFCGKLRSVRYLALISWDKICKPKDEGGIGVRDLKKMNQTLILKLVWQIASQDDKVWIGIMRAKYFSSGSLWETHDQTPSSALWKAIQSTKHMIKEDISWVIGYGKKIKAIHEPWVPFWDVQQRRGTPTVLKNLVVVDLIHPVTK